MRWKGLGLKQVEKWCHPQFTEDGPAESEALWIWFVAGLGLAPGGLIRGRVQARRDPPPRLGEPKGASSSGGLCPLLLGSEVGRLATVLPSSLVVSALAWAPAPARQAFPPGGTLQVPFSPESSVMILIDASFQQTFISRLLLPGTMLGMEGTVMNLPLILLWERRRSSGRWRKLTTQPFIPHLFYQPVFLPVTYSLSGVCLRPVALPYADCNVRFSRLVMIPLTCLNYSLSVILICAWWLLYLHKEMWSVSWKLRKVVTS